MKDLLCSDRSPGPVVDIATGSLSSICVLNIGAKHEAAAHNAGVRQNVTAPEHKRDILALWAEPTRTA